MNKYHLWLLAIILIALALRLYNLTYHSLWFDEAISVHWAKQPVPRILEVGFTLVEDRLPPLYYLMLKGWSGIFGFGESGVRGLSVAFGVLLVPVTAGIAALCNRRVALLSAALIALNPFLIWYSQEARMYAPAVFFGTFSIWAFLQVCKFASGKLQVNQPTNQPITNYQLPITKPDASRFTIYVLRFKPLIFLLLFTISAIAALYSHLYAGFLLPALGLWLITSYPRAWRLWAAFAVSGILIILAYTPILAAIWRFSAEADPSSDPLAGLVQRAWWILESFTIWKAPLSATLKTTVPATVILFALLAYFKPKTPKLSPQTSLITNYQLPITTSPISQSKIPNPLLLITLLLIFPFIIANILLFRNHLAFFGERYFIVMIPWLLILAAVGADNLSQWIKHGSRITDHGSRFMYFILFIVHYAPFAILILVTALPIPGQWSTTATKEAWRQSVAYLAKTATANHGILIHPDWVRYPFQYYFEGPGQTYAAFSNVETDTPLDGPLQGVVGHHEVVWLIQSHLDAPDPNRLVEQWFAARYPLVTELYPPGITLKGYAPGYQLDTLPLGATSIDITFENGMRLIGYQADEIAWATDELFHPPSGWVHVTLYWTADQPISVASVPFVHLVGSEGVWGASLNRPADALKLYPPSRWPAPSPIIRHDLDVNLNPTVPSGTYQLVVGLNGYETQYPLTQVEIRR